MDSEIRLTANRPEPPFCISRFVGWAVGRENLVMDYRAWSRKKMACIDRWRRNVLHITMEGSFYRALQIMRLRMLLDEIEILLVISEAKSLTQASERLYMSRPGLSQKIASIEARYGIKLYERTSTGIVPTQAGQIVTKFAKKISTLENSLAAELAAIDEHFDGTIEVGMSFNDGVALLPDLVKRFHDEHPDVRVHLDAGYEPELMEKLKAGKLDFAILENQPLEDDIAYDTLGYKRLVFLAPDKAPYNNTVQPIKIETVLKWPMIIYEWDSGRHMVGNRHFRERYGISLTDHNLVAQFDTHEAMVNGVKAGLGWASVPECIAERYRNEPGIIWFKMDTDPMRYPVDIAWHTGHIISDQASLFLEFIRANVPKEYFRRYRR